MRTILALVVAFTTASCATTLGSDLRSSAVDAGVRATDWSMKATIIEACSCPMFCQCYFNTEPAQHPGCCPPGADPSDAPRYCRFSNAFQVDEGRYGETDLKGAKFWVSGDLGSDFTAEKMPWARLHFDPAVSESQREGIVAALTALYPVKWESFEVGEDCTIDWKKGKDRSVAKLAGGEKGQVILKRNQGVTDDPIVIQNLRYWGASKNDGFLLMQNEIISYHVGENSYEYKGTNGFMITVHVDSESATGKAY